MCVCVRVWSDHSYARRCAQGTGLVDRGDYLWNRVQFADTRAPPDAWAPVTAYVLVAPQSTREAASTAAAAAATAATPSVTRASPRADAACHTPSGVVVGYLFVKFTLGSDRHSYESASVKDAWCVTPGAWMCVARYLEGLQSTVEKVHMHIPPAHPLLSMLSCLATDYKFTAPHCRFLRIVDVVKSITCRTFPAWLGGAVTLEVSGGIQCARGVVFTDTRWGWRSCCLDRVQMKDDVLAENNNKLFAIRIHNGRGTCRVLAREATTADGGQSNAVCGPGGVDSAPLMVGDAREVVTMDIRGYASLYAGFMAPDQLQSAGLLSCTEGVARAVFPLLRAMFCADGQPKCVEMF